jgi:hypothetical protein
VSQRATRSFCFLTGDLNYILTVLSKRLVDNPDVTKAGWNSGQHNPLALNLNSQFLACMQV